MSVRPDRYGRVTLPLTVLLLAATAFAQDAPPAATPQNASAYDAPIEQIRERCERLDQKDAAADVKVWTGVIADRKAGTVTVLAVATGIKPTDPLEFYVAPVDSGKDYESLAVTPATPSAVAEALQFIGLTAGRGIDPNANRFWARGPRLTVNYLRAGKTISGNDVAVDSRTGTPILGELLFAGSYTVKEGDATVLAADKIDARPIAPLYEHPAAVLAVPRRAPQSVVYGFQKPTAAAEWTRGELVEVVLTPDTRMAGRETENGIVHVKLQDGKPAYGLEYVGQVPAKFVNLPDFVATVEHWAPGKSGDLFTTVDIAPDVPVTAVRGLYAVLDAVEHDHGLKLDAPKPVDLYGRGFFPDPQWRDRTRRLGEPWELFLTRDAGKLTAKLERQADDPSQPAGSPPVLTSKPVADPAAFAAAVNAEPSKWTRSLFVYPPPDLTYGELMTWINPVLATYPRVFVFPADGPTTRPTP